MAINVTAKPGQRGDAVKELQSALAYLGLYKYAIDGWYGPKTAEAVKALQRMTRAAGYDPGPIDGWFGPQSQQAFNAWDRAVNPQNYGVGATGGAAGQAAPSTPPAATIATPVTSVPVASPPAPPPAPAPTPAPNSPEGRGARAIIASYLRQYGLEGLTDWAYSQVTSDAAFDANRFRVELREQDAYKQRFAGNEIRRQAGLAVLDESTNLQVEAAMENALRSSGMPPGFYDDRSDFAGFFIGANVSVAELQERINMHARYVQANPDVQAIKSEMQRFYGVAPTDGELAAYLLDPGRALPLLERQLRAAAASDRAKRAGVEQLDRTLAERAGTFSEGEQAAAFEQVAKDNPLYRPLYAGERQITTEEAISGTLDRNAAAQARIEQRRRRRIAATLSGQADIGAGDSRSALGSAL